MADPGLLSYTLALEFLLWPHLHLRPLGPLMQDGQKLGADLMSRGGPMKMEWNLHPPYIVSLIWHRFSWASVVFFAPSENTG